MTKIDIISGFLGAGKTTLIKRLLADALKGEQVVLIENEFGEIGIDGGFLKDAGIVVNEMNAGCICCSLVGDFGKALHDVVDQYHPDRILIEPSGVGKLSDVIAAVQNAHLDVQLNSFVTVVDALKAKMYLKNFGEFFENQVAHAGAILLSRTAECPEKRLDETVAMLRGLNEHARIVTTPWKDLTGEQLVEIAGKPILTWSAEAFDAVGDVGLIVIVCPEERMHEYLSRAIDPFPFVTPVVLAPSGAIRQESAFSGLEMVGDEYEYVVLHDGARPLVSPDLIEHTINMVKGNFDADGAIVAHPAVDTLKVVEDGVVVGTPDRSVFWNAQTPQVFRAGIYRRAHASALSDGFVGTDDSSLIERLGGKVLIVEGKRDNIKLTVPEDYVLLASAVRTMLLNSEHR